MKKTRHYNAPRLHRLAVRTECGFAISLTIEDTKQEHLGWD